MTDAGLEHLKALPRLTMLILWETNVTDAGLEHLKKLTQLQRLDLRSTKVTKAGATGLQETLPKCILHP